MGETNLRRWGLAAIAAGALLLAICAASAHPLSPALAMSGMALWALLLWRYPQSWLFVIPSALPFLNFLPWTGWQLIDEFDLLLATTIGVGYFRLLRDRRHLFSTPSTVFEAGLLIFLGSLIFGVIRGLLDAGNLQLEWFQGYTDAGNTLRVAKSSLFAMLLIPMLRQELGVAPERTPRLFAAGMIAGLSVVAGAACWERLQYPGLMNFAERYRTTALFWEMHVGGAAIDQYLAMTTPFALWAVMRSRQPWQWLLAALLAVLAAYAVLTSFSRGVYLGIVFSLLACGLFALRPRHQHLVEVVWRVMIFLVAGVALALILWWVLNDWGFSSLWLILGVLLFAMVFIHHLSWQRRAGGMLVIALLIESVVVLQGGSFMLDRLAASDKDFGNRLQHWRKGIDLLSGPADWVLGLGLGRLPAHYTAAYLGGRLPGDFSARQDGTQGFLRIQGPHERPYLSGLYTLAQRVEVGTQPARIELNVRADHDVELMFELCDRHLLYMANCRYGYLGIHAQPDQWQSFAEDLAAIEPDSASLFPRSQVFSMAVIGDQGVDVSDLRLLVDSRNVLLNGDFKAGLAHWYPAAQLYFLPWHIDNFYLELLVERGLLAGAFMLLAIGWAMRRLLAANVVKNSFSWIIFSALLGALTVGLASSLRDTGRVAFLFDFMVVFAICFAAARDNVNDSGA